MKRNEIPRHVLPVIVVAQFAGTSLWFAGNAVSPLLIDEFGLSESITGFMVSSVQVGFIAGTLVFALLNVADRFSPVKVFFICSLAGALSNISLIITEGNIFWLLIMRFFTGFFLAGIYPVGMKIAADWYEKRLGTALGWLVGALTLGTAFPHLIKLFPVITSWKSVFVFTSVLASSGGLLLILTVKEGPYRSIGSKLELSGFINTFRNKKFRGAAYGYFGHMWELYAFWTFLPVLLQQLFVENNMQYNISLWSFAVIFLGMAGCILSGYMSRFMGSGKTAALFLFISGSCCVLFPWISEISAMGTVILLLLWGFSVVADSPQFSTLVANLAIPEYKGSALTLVNSLGFAITIPSIELLNWLFLSDYRQFATIMLCFGPVLGLIFLLKSKVVSLQWLTLES